jgi:hypothetical protein
LTGQASCLAQNCNPRAKLLHIHDTSLLRCFDIGNMNDYLFSEGRGRSCPATRLQSRQQPAALRSAG